MEKLIDETVVLDPQTISGLKELLGDIFQSDVKKPIVEQSETTTEHKVK